MPTPTSWPLLHNASLPVAGGWYPSMANSGWHALFHCSCGPLPSKFSISFSLLQMEVVSTFKRSGSFQGAVRRRSSVLSQLHDVTNISTPTHVILSAANASAGAGSESWFPFTACDLKNKQNKEILSSFCPLPISPFPFSSIHPTPLVPRCCNHCCNIIYFSFFYMSGLMPDLLLL